jgi:uncharacterized protein (TIGR02594 family)
MKKTILIVSLMLAPFALANPVQARPNNENTPITVTQQPVKKKKVVKKKPVKKVQAAVVAPENNPFLKDRPIFGYSHEESVSQYWAEERARQERERQQQVASSLGLKKKETPKKTPVDVRRDCFWFICNEEKTSKPVYAEAKKWEGKNAKKHRGELKSLMAAGNNNQPVDPVRIPWCAGFVNAILARSGYETTGSLMARSFLNYGVVTKDPEIGDIVVTKRGRSQVAGHVGFFEGYEWYEGVKYIKVYGGNTAKSVQVGYFPANQVLGYRRPTTV